MSKPLGITKANQKDHNSRKNPHMAEQFATKRKANNAERPKQVWTWVNEELAGFGLSTWRWVR